MRNLSEIVPPIEGTNSALTVNHSTMASPTMGHKHSWQVNSSSEQLYLRYYSY
jgi:hypothetical protein